MYDDEPLDPRSTGRKRGRKALEDIQRPYWCGSTQDGGIIDREITRIDGSRARVGCGRSPTDSSAPGGYYPGMGQLQVNHINKNILDNDPVNLEWLCASCHKDTDRQTEKGVSIKGDEWGYGIPTSKVFDIPGPEVGDYYTTEDSGFFIRVIAEEEDD